MITPNLSQRRPDRGLAVLALLALIVMAVIATAIIGVFGATVIDALSHPVNRLPDPHPPGYHYTVPRPNY